MKLPVFIRGIGAVLDRHNRRVAVAAAAIFFVGVALSSRIEPGVRVKAVTLAGTIPAIEFQPAAAGPHPVALLAHGLSASKETLFCYGEALAAAGFTCFSVDLPGHGASAERLSFRGNISTIESAARAVGPVDIFLGHSMGGLSGGEAVRQGGLSPRFFIAVGSLPNLGGHGPPLLLLAGRYEELLPPARLKERTDARLVISPWSDHVLEPYDPCLVNAAVEAACGAVSRTPPAPPTRWRWRLAGSLLGTLGSLGLALSLPRLPHRWAWLRGPLVSTFLLFAFALTARAWVGVALHLSHAPQEVGAIVLAWLVIMSAGRLGIPRWSFPAVAAAATLGFGLVGAIRLLTLFLWLLTIILMDGTIIGGLAEHRGSRRDGDIAMAIIVGYAVGQWIPRLL